MNLFTSSFKRIFKERIVLFIPVLAGILVVFHLVAPPSDGFRVIENNSFWKKKTFDKNKYEIVVCGDSRIYRGISPDHMKEILSGYKIINLGYGSAGYGDIMLNEINKRIDFESKKSMVILGITPLSLTHEGEMNWHLRTELATKKEELIELLYFKKISQFFIPFTFSEMEKHVKGKDFYTSKKQEYLDGGWVATYEEKPWEIAALKSYSTRFINNQVLESNINRLVKATGEWTEKGIQVFAFRPPTTEKMVALEDSLSGFNESNIRERLENKGAIYLDFEMDKYTTFDGSHLQKESAIRFSKDLANAIANNHQSAQNLHNSKNE
ncbi:hypothetical protein OU798_24495 [Prolixibacteraceae bacterium Z1-6]|uniref:Uncharacterized protein n=1 Tax=Draconibacterium aestuarii TaxID=2998507 RepID=A0A9X3FAC4_9BACT|nr:hypothetical protein [Prolixibacteraceae bacterium Z1-6]